MIHVLGVELECTDSAESEKQIQVNNTVRKTGMKKWKTLSFYFLNLLCLTTLIITQKWIREIHILCVFITQLFSYQPWSTLFLFLNTLFKKEKYLFIWLHQVLVVACKPLVAACGIQFCYQGLNLGPLHWKHGVLSPGQSGKSLFLNTFEATP